MAQGVLMPKQGITVESCIITKWYKKKGDKVEVGEALFGYETDKATFDCESTAAGEILEIFFNDGDDVPVLVNVCAVGTAGEDISALKPDGASEETAVAAEPAKEVKEEVKTAVAEVNATGTADKISPRAKALADKAGVDVRTVAATGPYGRVIERDIQSAIENGNTVTKAAFGEVKSNDTAKYSGTGIGGRVTVGDLASKTAAALPSEIEYEDVKLPGIRKAISKAMVTSLSTMAQLTNNTSFDMTDIMKFRAELKKDAEAMGSVKITINDIILFVVSRTLTQFENINANLFDDTIRHFKDVHLGVAVDTDRGLMVPTVMYANRKSLVEISKEVKDLAKQAQSGTINPDLLKNGTFTVTNLGTFGVESFTPVINPPQTAILGVNTIVTGVREKDGKIETYPSMTLSLTYDHRVVDGAPAAKFAKAVKENLERFTYFLAVNGGM